MKLTYQKPNITVAYLATTVMTVTSDFRVHGSTDDPDDLLSREALPHYSVWDDEEEEDDLIGLE